MLIVNNFKVSFYTKDLEFIKKVTDRTKVDDITYDVDAGFYFQNHYTEAGLLYHVEIVILDYDRPIRRIEKYCVLTLEDIGWLNMKNKECVFHNIFALRPNDLEAKDINIRIF